MTEEVQTSEVSQSTPPLSDSVPQGQSLSETLNSEKLYANKFKTVEDLEKAYGNSVTAMVEKARLEKELERYRPPEQYTLPGEIPFSESQREELSNIARNAGFTQEQFEKTALEMHKRIEYGKQAQENFYSERKTAIGEERLNLLKDYVEKSYPEYAREIILDKLIKDESAMSDALKDRENKLNSQAPGLSQGRTGIPERYEGERELKAAALAAQKNPRDPQARAKYINLARDVAHARKR